MANQPDTSQSNIQTTALSIIVILAFCIILIQFYFCMNFSQFCVRPVAGLHCGEGWIFYQRWSLLLTKKPRHTSDVSVKSSGHHDITRHPVLQSPPTQSNEMLELNTAQCRPQQIYLRLRWELLQFVWLFTEIKNVSCWDYFVITALKITYIFIHLLR